MGYLFGSTLKNVVGDNWRLFCVALLAVFFLTIHLTLLDDFSDH